MTETDTWSFTVDEDGMVFVVAPLGVPGNVRLAADARGEHPVATGTFTGSGASGSGFAWSRTFFAVWCEVALGSV